MTPLRDTLFTGRAEQAFFRWWRSAFSIREIEEGLVLQWVFGATILSYFVTFGSWIGRRAMTVDAYIDGTYRCWPYFQSCGEWYFLRALPDGYSQNFLYMGLFALFITAVYCMYRRDWVLAHLALLPAFLWHALSSFVFSGELAGNYDYYLFIFAFVLLFLPHKYFFLKVSVVVFYFLSTVSKMHEAWILGTYFSALKTGLPLFPDWSIPLWTNLVIFMEMVGTWFLLSKNPWLQRAALAFFAIFHLYSGLLVEYRYPSTVLPTLLILFGPLYQHTAIPFDRRAIPGFVLVVFLFMLQFSPLVIPGDEKMTLEANKYGLYMFESNHQCISTARAFFTDGTEREGRTESRSARSRCDPYYYWFTIKLACERSENVARIQWTFDHSINGEPFLRIVDVPDACALEYQPFAHNEWIKTEKDSPAIIGYPVENVFY